MRRLKYFVARHCLAQLSESLVRSLSDYAGSSQKDAKFLEEIQYGAVITCSGSLRSTHYERLC